ncbi:MAG TPA: periplasmic heavy metal sensor [Bdellovibrionota bacterium]|nr:periplasmic heavy metal sensor [Bdellovibrionota bacterium]
MKSLSTLGLLALLAFPNVVRADHGCQGECPHERGGKGAWGHRFGTPGAREPHGTLFLDYATELKLTDAQIVKLNKLRLKAHDKKMELKEKMFGLHAEVAKMAHEQKPDRKAIEKKADEIGKLKGEMVKLRVSTVMDAKEELNDQQRKKLMEIFDSKYHGMKMGGGDSGDE